MLEEMMVVLDKRDKYVTMITYDDLSNYCGYTCSG